MILRFSIYGDCAYYKNRMNDKISGKTTVNDVKIKTQSKSFIDCVLGTNKYSKVKKS